MRLKKLIAQQLYYKYKYIVVSVCHTTWIVHIFPEQFNGDVPFSVFVVRVCVPFLSMQSEYYFSFIYTVIFKFNIRLL